MNKLQYITGCDLFNGLPQEQLEKIAEIGVSKKYGRGTSIFFEGDDGDGFYLIAEGKVKVFKLSLSGKEQILHIFGGGEIFGEVPVFNGTPFPATAQTLASSQLIYFPRKSFIELITRYPSISLNMLAILSLRLRRFTTQIENLSLKEVPQRLAGYLLYLMDEQGNHQQVTLDISKGQLASLLGTIPETLSRIFAKMGEEGLIAVKGREIEILDQDGLVDRAG